MLAPCPPHWDPDACLLSTCGVFNVAVADPPIRASKNDRGREKKSANHTITTLTRKGLCLSLQLMWYETMPPKMRGCAVQMRQWWNCQCAQAFMWTTWLCIFPCFNRGASVSSHLDDSITLIRSINQRIPVYFSHFPLEDSSQWSKSHLQTTVEHLSATVRWLMLTVAGYRNYRVHVTEVYSSAKIRW